ncbi:SPOSA6832_01260 [Sporobolomyces salmonicolor]|uniref:Pre-mRNA-splicing factor SYF2 n=1 Tax=Sporidiobolus salmonicolor TaxID=5005 RepID=A0A0D6EIC5_SPOSA|nr:SPOSA6832_01260 [Sporobolomyces salmonicolor]
MPPRKSARSKQAAAPPPAPEEVQAAVDSDQHPVASTSTSTSRSNADDAQEEAQQAREHEEQGARADQRDEEAASSPAGGAASGSSLDDRMAKMKQLRQRMSESARLNRQDVISEMSAQRASARALAKLERKRQQAEAMGEKQRARETGEDLERTKNWEYSIEDNERWDKKLARKERRADFSFTEVKGGGPDDLDRTDYDDIARRKYKKDLDDFKPDLAAYNAQRAAAESSSQALIASGSGSGEGTVAQHLAAQDLYRDANSFIYADHKPTEDQIDRVIGKLNSDLDKRQKRSRKRENEDQGDITWINEKNRQFNRKLARYYDDVTKETRDNFERGTAL